MTAANTGKQGAAAAALAWLRDDMIIGELVEQTWQFVLEVHDSCWRSTKVAFCDQRKSRSRGGVRPAWVTLAASAFGGVCGGGGEGLVLA